MPQPIFNQHEGPRLAPRSPALRRRAGGAGAVSVRPRSARYLAALGRLDASATLTPTQLQEVIDGIHREFAEQWAAIPLGFVGHCYLGPPYEAHTLTVDAQIIEHYVVGQALPGRLEQARALARSEHYLVIEVYPDQLVCVRTDGSVATVEG